MFELAHTILDPQVVNDFCLVPHVNCNSLGIVSGGADGVLKLSVIRTSYVSVASALTFLSETEGMCVEGSPPSGFGTSLVMNLGSYDTPINTVASIAHNSLPLTLVAFAGISSEIQILARCRSLRNLG